METKIELTETQLKELVNKCASTVCGRACRTCKNLLSIIGGEEINHCTIEVTSAFQIKIKLELLLTQYGVNGSTMVTDGRRLALWLRNHSGTAFLDALKENL